VTSAGFIGFWAVFPDGFQCEDARVHHVAELLVDDRWPWSPWWVCSTQVGSLTKETRSKRVAGGAKGAAHLATTILDPKTATMWFSCRKRGESLAIALLETGRTMIGCDWRYRLKTYGQTRAHALPEGRTIESWISLIHELMTTLDVANAVLPVYATDAAVHADLTFGSIILDSRWTGRTDLGPGPSFSEQNDRANWWRRELGASYVRNARWGTYLRDHHVEAIGGLDRIRREVAPARVTVLGPLVYFQLTETVDEALTDACEAKRRAFDTLLAPILPPPRETP
jgi:hypothetical protein